MTTTPLLWLLALASGALIPVQAASNSALSRAVGGNVPFAALTLFLSRPPRRRSRCSLAGQGVPTWADLKQAPWWSYSGGFIVAFYVFTITFLSPRLGVGAAIALVVAGQVISALAIDHYGLLRSLTFSLTPTRLIGAVLMVIGVFLALRR